MTTTTVVKGNGMSKYIDADKLEKNGWNIHRMRQTSSIEMVYEVKKPTDFPAADVVEVRHGRWVDVDPAPYNLFYATCSVCGDRQTIEVANYCPMCGASMNGDTE